MNRRASRTSEIAARPPWESGRMSRLAGPVVFAAVLAAAALGLATVGLADGQRPVEGVIGALGAGLGGFITPSLYLLAAFGIGRPLSALLGGRRGGGSASRLHVQLALGVGMMLWLSHALGVLGLLSDQGPLGGIGSRACAWAAVGGGLVLLLHQVARGELRPERWPVFPLRLVMWAPAIGVMVIAACNPPGALWDSEFGGYDVLSYHLQLAKEWGAGPLGRVWPVDHNIYSFLPSYTESAFVHLGAMTPGSGAAIHRMLSTDAHWVYACQFLHVGLAVVCAILTARLASVLVGRAGVGAAGARFAGACAGALLLSTPWTVVAASMAYNEMAMLAMMAGALLMAMDDDDAADARRRGLGVGFLVGIACSAKPTAMMLVAPVVAVCLIFGGPWRSARALVGVCVFVAIGGMAAIGPWLIRNALAASNPVFPFASGLFGTGRWTGEQVDRYLRWHRPPAGTGLADRVRLLVERSGATLFEQARGLGHEQWALVPWVGAGAWVAAMLWRPTHRAAALLGLCALVQVCAWMATTHMQSRFLLPVLVPMSLAFGLAAAAVLALAQRRGRGSATGVPLLAAAVLAAMPLTGAGWAALVFTKQLGGHPNRSLTLGAGAMSGMLWESGFESAAPADREAFLERTASPTVYLNLAMRRGGEGNAGGTRPAADGVYLLGDATPLYDLEALGEPGSAAAPTPARPSRVHYHTVWNLSPLGDAVEAGGDDPVAWSRWMQSHGYGYVLVNYSELGRLVGRDRTFDPRVTAGVVEQWLGPDSAAGLTSVRAWTVTGRDGVGRRVWHELFRIHPQESP